jgi:uncharacterized membrane protein YphA (DoxX/SURF4 family)
MFANQHRVNTVQQLLRLIFGVVPVVAGADKFFNLLTSWSQYLNPTLEQFLPFSAATFMHIVGIVEIAAGLIVLSRFTVIGGYVVSAWLALIALSLIASGNYLDVAVRDLVMSAGAYSMAVLTEARQKQNAPAYKEVHAQTLTA